MFPANDPDVRSRKNCLATGSVTGVKILNVFYITLCLCNTVRRNVYKDSRQGGNKSWIFIS